MKNQNDGVCASSQRHEDAKEKGLYEKPKLGAVNLFADKVLNSPCSNYTAGCDIPYNASKL